MNVWELLNGTVKMPISPDSPCMGRRLEVNERYCSIEVSGNFGIGEQLPSGHYPALLRLLRDQLGSPTTAGTICLPPIFPVSSPQRMLFVVNQLKQLSRLPT